MDMLSPDAGEAIAQHLLDEADRLLEEENEVRMPYFLLVLSRDPRTKEAYDEPSIKVFRPDDRNLRDFLNDQNEYLGIINTVKNLGDAVCAGVLMETWNVPKEDAVTWEGRYHEHPHRYTEIHVHVNHVNMVKPISLVCRIQEGHGRRRGPVVRDNTVSGIGGRIGDAISLSRRDT